MPGYDRTGPNGMGPMTGRGMGSCGGGLRRGFGRGFGRGRGFGFRFRFQNPQVISEKEEKQMLEEELKAIAEEQKEMQKRLKELK